jgi:hypothetical protein
MQVNAKVRESVIDQIDRGIKARIRVDALPGELLTGVVVEVSPLPDAAPFFRGATKTCTTKIRIDKGPKAVRPGMTAQVEILVADRANVLSVPVQSVHRIDDKDYRMNRNLFSSGKFQPAAIGRHGDLSHPLRRSHWYNLRFHSVATRPIATQCRHRRRLDSTSVSIGKAHA